MKNNKTLNQLANEGAKYVVIKKDDTQYWHKDIQAKAAKIWTVSLVNLTQPTHLCELAISYPYEEIKHFFEDIKDGVNMDDIFEHEYAELTDGYFTGNSAFIVEKIYNDERDFDECFENENCNPTVC